MEVLKIGSRGTNVKELQYKLHLIPDGIFGKQTEEAVKNFLKSLGIIADGIVGDSTWTKLLRSASRYINEIILHCSATPEGKDVTVETIRAWHKARGFSDIGYHYVIYRDGSIHLGRSVSLAGAHCVNHNSHSIGICYIGGCDSTGKKAKDTRTPLLKQALVELVKRLLIECKLKSSNVHAHYEYANKACPSFKIEDFRKELGYAF